MSADHYRTLTSPAEARLKIERSDFLGIAMPIASEDEFMSALRQIEKRYHDATHHCWAFRMFAPERARSSDAGEPSGTAGKPILGAIESAGLFDAGLIVVRWFGGVKLGTGGLARAYRETATETLRSASTVQRYLYDRVVVTAPYDMLNVIYRLAAPPDVVLEGESFGESNEFTFAVRKLRTEGFTRELTERRLQWR